MTDSFISLLNLFVINTSRMWLKYDKILNKQTHHDHLRFSRHFLGRPASASCPLDSSSTRAAVSG